MKKSSPSKRTSRTRKKATPDTSLQALFPDFRPPQFAASAMKRRAEYSASLREAYLHRGLVLYVGAGVSLSLGLPSWPELIRALSVTMMSRRVETAIDALENLSDEKKWERLSALQAQVEERADSSKPILMMARAVKDELGERLPFVVARTLYRPVLHYLFRRFEESWHHPRSWRMERHRSRSVRSALPTSELMDAIVALCRAERDVSGVQAIVNYNYDDLLDEKLREQHVKCKTVLSGRDVAPAGTLPSYHVHGLLASKDVASRKRVEARGNFVFSEDEYHAEYSDPYKWSNMTQMSLLGKYTGLFVGLSMEDPNIRRLIDVTHRQYPEHLNYAILPRKKVGDAVTTGSNSVMRNLFEQVESNSFERIGVRVIWVDSFTEIPSILNSICGAEAAGQHGAAADDRPQAGDRG